VQGVSHIQTSEDDDGRVVRDLLESIGRDGAQTQRHLAKELGVALGLVNAYLKRCVGKGLVKVQQAPARRYAYYLTPKGFAEKSRLTISYLAHSMNFFRMAKADCIALFEEARRRDFTQVALVGRSDLAEICIICGMESGIKVVAIVDASPGPDRFVGVPVVGSLEALDARIDAVVITDLLETRQKLERAMTRFGAGRVLVPDLLGLYPSGKDTGE
jgi:DNA-binding MarR family transcriptional regulator